MNQPTDPLLKVTGYKLNRDSPEAKKLLEQWDEEYQRPKKQADLFRELGVPPLPRPQPSSSGETPYSTSN